MIDTSYTRRIHTLRTTVEIPMTTFRSYCLKLSEKQCREEVDFDLLKRSVDEEDIMIHAVNVKCMHIGWLTTGEDSEK